MEIVPSSQETEDAEDVQFIANLLHEGLPASMREDMPTRKPPPKEMNTVGVQVETAINEQERRFQLYWCSPFAAMPERPERAMDLDGPINPGLTQYGFFSALRDHVIRWASRWGGVAVWPDVMEVQWETVLKHGGKGRARLWVKEMWTHADNGHDLLRRLDSMERVLPVHPLAMRLLWREQLKMCKVLYEGIAVIETRVDILKRRLFTLGLGHDEFERLFLDFVQRWNSTPVYMSDPEPSSDFE